MLACHRRIQIGVTAQGLSQYRPGANDLAGGATVFARPQWVFLVRSLAWRLSSSCQR